ncbi:hypothetical protein AAG570_007770 [Ranatra chinensis]|uniref:Uncharacterized protein n=1 Tax=Ranatra chinensis TaxID=642074 RepID=A0ABD0XUH8_9HEMI
MFHKNKTQETTENAQNELRTARTWGDIRPQVLHYPWGFYYPPVGPAGAIPTPASIYKQPSYHQGPTPVGLRYPYLPYAALRLSETAPSYTIPCHENLYLNIYINFVIPGDANAFSMPNELRNDFLVEACRHRVLNTGRR